MLLNLLAAVVGALPQGLALLLGIGAAVYLALRASRAAGIAVGIGVLLLGLDVLVSVLVYPGLLAAAEVGALTPDLLQLSFSVLRLLTTALHGLGVIALLVAACVGPAPVRAEEAA